ncbi:MAG: hypothetical protein ISS57_03870 [Anaerolineales bacterium]|nr:hypothetical protein [Anaerolineales bacterium]
MSNCDIYHSVDELAAQGISIDEVTLELEGEGVRASAETFTNLLNSVESRRRAAI